MSKKLLIGLFSVILLISALCVGCIPQDVTYINDSPPIDVNVSSGTVTATVSNPLPISISGVTVNDGAVPSVPYYYQITDGKVIGHTPWSKIGFNPALVAATEADCWSATGLYVFPTASAGMEVRSSDNTKDIGTVIFSGTSSGGTATSLIDATKNFNGGTAVAIGDCIVLDKSGTLPEWGYVSAVTSNTELAVSGGFSSSGTGFGTVGRAYSVIDKSGYTGAQVVKIDYLDGDYVDAKTEIVILNGTTVIPTVNLNLFRINSFRVIATGTDNKPTGNLELRNLADTPFYSYITAGFTRARNIMYTVPAGYTLFVTSGTFGYAYSHDSTHYARIFTKANLEPSTGFHTGSLFYPYTEVVESNGTVVREFEIPTKLPQKTDIKISVIADYAGIAEVALRGWLETN